MTKIKEADLSYFLALPQVILEKFFSVLLRLRYCSRCHTLNRTNLKLIWRKETKTFKVLKTIMNKEHF